MTITDYQTSITLGDYPYYEGSSGTLGQISGWPSVSTVASVSYSGAVCTYAFHGPPNWYDDDGNMVTFMTDVPYSELHDY